MNKEELISLEQKLHDPIVRKNINELNKLLSDEFFEFGSSGIRWTKEKIIDALLSEDSVVFVAKGASKLCNQVEYKISN